MISVIVPVYNVGDYVEKCLESIIKQTYKDFELVLVNDGSTDMGMEKAWLYLLDRDVEYKIINKKNGGLASARNAGLEEASGEYVVFIDADDAVSEDFLQNLYDAFTDETDFTFCAYKFVKKQSPPLDDKKDKTVYGREELLEVFLKRSISFVVPSMLFRKSFLLENKLFFDEELRFSEDQPFIWNVILHSNKSVFLHKQMYGYYIRDNSIMTSSSYEKISNSHAEFKTVIEKTFNDYPEYKETETMIVPRWQLGALYTSSNLLDYDDYKKIYDEMQGRTILKRLIHIKEKKAYLLATVCSLSPKMLYWLCRKLNLNG